MKKHLLLLLLALAASVVQAQEGEKESFYSYMHHDSTGYSQVVDCDMQQRDGNLVTEIFYIEDTGSYMGVPYGYMLYKISPAPLAIIDTLFMSDTTYRHKSFLARDPRGDGNIRAVYEYDEGSDSSFVRISHFPDNDLHATLGEDVVVPLCEGVAYPGMYTSLVDSRGDLVMLYFKARDNGNDDEYVARIGLDGTLKCQALLAEDINSLSTIREFKESPLQYYQWGLTYPSYNPHLAVYVIDSLFRKNTVILNNILRSEEISPLATVYEYLNFNYDTEVLSNGGDEVLVAAQYTCDTNFYALTQDVGTAVAKYDLRTMQLKGYVVFNDFHYYSSKGYPLGFKKMGDGTLYFLYKEHLYPEESVIIVKMDTDFNVEWKRFCKTGDVTICPPFNPPVVLEDETGEETGIAWFGYSIQGSNHETGWVCFVVSHDGTVGVNEGGVEVRPYAFYPNPARNELRLQFSPDVKPAHIELYDLQGRMVCSSDNGLEVLNLQGLASGQYVMKVTLDDGKVFTDKVVKE